MEGYGIPEAEIARVLDIDPTTLRKNYRDNLDTGHSDSRSTVMKECHG